MINVAGNTNRSFMFPAPLATAYSYYSDAKRIFAYLPYITLVQDYENDCFQVLYERLELGQYLIQIFANVQFVLQAEQRTLLVRPFAGGELVKTKAGLISSTAQGYFSSQSVFQQVENETRIEYRLALQATLPTPLGLRLMPERMVDGIADRITNWRIREIAEGFIDRSIAAFG